MRSFALTSASREDERICARASSAAVRPPCLRLNKFIWSDVSPPSVIWERMRLLVFATLFGVLLDAGRSNLSSARFQSVMCEGSVWSAGVLCMQHKTKCAFIVHICSMCFVRNRGKMPVLQTIFHFHVFYPHSFRHFMAFNLRIYCFKMLTTLF